MDKLFIDSIQKATSYENAVNIVEKTYPDVSCQFEGLYYGPDKLVSELDSKLGMKCGDKNKLLCVFSLLYYNDNYLPAQNKLVKMLDTCNESASSCMYDGEDMDTLRKFYRSLMRQDNDMKLQYKRYMSFIDTAIKRSHLTKNELFADKYKIFARGELLTKSYGIYGGFPVSDIKSQAGSRFNCTYYFYNSFMIIVDLGSLLGIEVRWTEDMNGKKVKHIEKSLPHQRSVIFITDIGTRVTFVELSVYVDEHIRDSGTTIGFQIK